MQSFSGAIGVVGGVGPYAGLDLMRKIFDQTRAACDQDHLPVIQYSLSHKIADRTAFLLGAANDNPGQAIGEIMVGLAHSGATVIGMPCNTAHSPAILDPALAMLTQSGRPVRFVHMIDAVVRHIRATWPKARRVGVLSTVGTFQTGIYQEPLERAGFEALFPEPAGRERVQNAISHSEYGIKAQSNPVTPEAKRLLTEEARALKARGAEAVILGCTEIPLALTEPDVDGMPLVDATYILASALIGAFTGK